MIKDLKDSLQEVIALSPKSSQKDYEDLMFVLANEFHWTQEDIYNTDIPFILNLLNARKRFNDEQERQLRKNKKGK